MSPKLTDFTRDQLNLLYSAVACMKKEKTETLYVRNQIWKQGSDKLHPSNDRMKKEIEDLALWETQILVAIGDVAVQELTNSN